MRTFYLALFLTGCITVPAPGVLAFELSMPSFSLAGLGQFMSSIKSLLGSGSEFSQKYGYNYKDVYSDQLMLQAVNTFTNQQQKQEEIKQEDLMRKDMESEKTYFTMLCIFMGMCSFLLLVMVFLMLRQQNWTIGSKRRDRIIDEYIRDRELKTFAARAQGGSSEV